MYIYTNHVEMDTSKPRNKSIMIMTDRERDRDRDTQRATDTDRQREREKDVTDLLVMLNADSGVKNHWVHHRL